MIIIFFAVCLFINIPTVSAHNANIKGYADKNSNYVSNCANKNYGYHKQDGNNHWHEVKFKDGKWIIIDPNKTYDKDPCKLSDKIQVDFKRCVDGDTAVLSYNGQEEKYRFLAVDTPESVHPTKDVELYAKEASKNTCDLLTNASTIMVKYDSNSDEKDKYNRNLVWVWVDDILLQELMVSEGYARVSYIYGNYEYIDELCMLQKNAISSNKGIWQYGYEVGYCETKEVEEITSDDIKKIYVVSFKDENNNSEVKVAQHMKVKPLDPKGKTGYVFSGWYYNGKLFDFSTAITKNITLEAKYRLDYIYIIMVIIVLLIGIMTNKKERKHGKNNQKSAKYNRKKRI